MYTQEELKAIINKAILNISYEEGAEKLYEPVKYILSVGGKRIRPVMTLMACNMFSDSVNNAIVPAVGLEVFHNFTLVHDDIMDKSSLRRGAETVHEKWDINQAILSGDVMPFIAGDAIAQAPVNIMPEILKIYYFVARQVCIGQQLDMDFETSPYVSHQEYLEMVEKKTAVLIAGALKMGALIGGASKADCDLIYNYGLNIGLAFQVQDDILDTFGDQKVFGKKTGNDIVSNKKTLLLIKAFELASGEQLKQLQLLIHTDKDIDPADKISRVKQIYEDLDIEAWARKLEEQYINKAIESLEKISVDKARKENLLNLTLSMQGRNR